MSFRPTSLMFVFSYLYFCTYVLSPIIMLSDKNIVGVHNKPSEYYLYFAMVLSILVYIIIFFGYIKAKDCNRRWNLKIVLNLKIFYLVALCSMLFFIYFHWDSILARLFYHKPIEVFKVSNGSGVFILISSIYKYCFIFFIAYIFIKIKNNEALKISDIMTILVLCAFLFFTGFILTSRRDFAVVFLSIFFISALLYQRKIFGIMLTTVVILIPFFAPILQILRYSAVQDKAQDLVNNGTYLAQGETNSAYNEIQNEVQGGTQFESAFEYWIYYFKQTHVSSFEGYWLASFLEKINLKEFMLGINIFEPIGNFLSYIPRFIWSSKPYDTGIMEIQKFLAPQSLTNIINSNGGGYGVTLPSTLVVELVYATGIVGCLVFAYFIGKIFYKLDILLSRNQNNIIVVSLFFYLYCYMFDFIRNGSAFLVSLFVPLSILAIMVKRSNKSQF